MNPKIISAYTGVGKSTFAYHHKGEAIDLEASCFNIGGVKPSAWEIPYCNLAVSLYRAGYTVLVSSHEDVRRELAKRNKEGNFNLYLVYPSETLKQVWIKNIEHRYKISQTPETLLSSVRVKNFFDEDIESMRLQENFKHIVLDNMGYDFEKILAGGGE